jgi:hypothetical protein
MRKANCIALALLICASAEVSAQGLGHSPGAADPAVSPVPPRVQGGGDSAVGEPANRVSRDIAKSSIGNIKAREKAPAATNASTNAAAVAAASSDKGSASEASLKAAHEATHQAQVSGPAKNEGAARKINTSKSNLRTGEAPAVSPGTP